MENTTSGWSNWSGRVRATGSVLRPRNEAELADLMRKADGPIRPAGTGHSFTPLCASSGTIIDLSEMSGLIEAWPDRLEAELWAGTPIYAVGPLLHAHGMALANQGDIDRQTLGGAIGTGTHGTGAELGSLASMVTGATLSTPSGEILTLNQSSDPEAFECARLSLGSLGVITRLKLKLDPSFALKEHGFPGKMTDMLPTLSQAAGIHRHFEFFWFPYADSAAMKMLDIADVEPERVLAIPAMQARGERRSWDDTCFELICKIVRVLPWSSAYFHRFLTRQMTATETRPGRTRWSWEAFPSARTTRFNEMEYAVPAARGADAIKAVVDLVRKERIPTAFPFEFRYVQRDDVWLSPFYGRDSATISVHQYAPTDQTGLFRACEEVFLSFDGRPHWGKQHSLGAKDFARIYPHWEDFQRIRRRLDPTGKMMTPYMRELMEDGPAVPGRIR